VHGYSIDVGGRGHTNKNGPGHGAIVEYGNGNDSNAFESNNEFGVDDRRRGSSAILRNVPTTGRYDEKVGTFGTHYFNTLSLDGSGSSFAPSEVDGSTGSGYLDTDYGSDVGSDDDSVDSFEEEFDDVTTEVARTMYSKFVGGMYRYVTNIIVPSGHDGIHGCLRELDSVIDHYPPPTHWYIIGVQNEHIHVHHMCPYSNHSCRCTWYIHSTSCAKFGVRRLRHITRGVDLQPINYTRILRYLSEGDRFIHRIGGFAEDGGLFNRYQHLLVRIKKLLNTYAGRIFKLLR